MYLVFVNTLTISTVILKEEFLKSPIVQCIVKLNKFHSQLTSKQKFQGDLISIDILNANQSFTYIVFLSD